MGFDNSQGFGRFPAQTEVLYHLVIPGSAARNQNDVGQDLVSRFADQVAIYDWSE